MSTISCNKTDNLGEIIRKVLSSSGDELQLQVPEGALFWQNPANQKIVEFLSKKNGKQLKVELLRAEGENVKSIVKEEFEKPKKKKSKSNLRERFAWLQNIRKPSVVLIIGVLLVLFATGALAFTAYYLPRAEVTLKVSKRTLERDSEVFLRTEQVQIDSDTSSIPADVVSKSVSNSREITATGTKVIGDPATGEILIRNWNTEVAITLPTGTVIVVREGTGEEASCGGLIYTTNGSVTVPQAEKETQGNSVVTTAGTATITVTASDVGEGYNLPSGQLLCVGNRPYTTDESGMQATNQQAFAGGTTQEVTIVSQQDVDTAYAQLQSELETQAKEELQKEVGEGKKLVESDMNTQVTNQSSDKAVGAEASTFTIDMAITVEATTYTQVDLEKLITQRLQDSVPEGFILSEDDLVVRTQYVGRSEEGFVTLQASIEALLIPQIDEGSLKEQLRGIRPEQVEGIVNQIEHVQESEVILWPRLPSFIQRMPFIKDRLTITIESE